MTKITYLGHSCFTLEKDGALILIDPFLTGNPMAAAGPAQVNPTLILATHGHGDHLGDAVDVSKRTGAPIMGTYELGMRCQAAGAKVVAGHYGGIVSFDFGKVKIVPAWHSSSIGDDLLFAGNPCGFVVTFPDTTVYHAGDTTVFGDMRLIAQATPIDIALLPIGGFYTMGVDDAVIAVELLQAKEVIPMHYDTMDVIKQDPLEFKQKVEARTKAQVVILKPGEAYVV
ncbi:MAG: metal-dependent hydrolase [Chloroflexi bacterium]|nr:metal-dependent hydrolase [Chloroflexota bacterium]